MNHHVHSICLALGAHLANFRWVRCQLFTVWRNRPILGHNLYDKFLTGPMLRYSHVNDFGVDKRKHRCIPAMVFHVEHSCKPKG
jgi:hypothetical protein